MAFLEIERLHKNYGPVEVLKDVDLSIEEGGFLVLVGPSGCGKSTLLYTIAGLESITRGEIRIDGRAVNDLPPSKRDIAMVFQSYALYPTMSVAENMGFGMEMRGVPRDERRRAVAEVAKTLRIEHLLSRRPGQLSGGQRQRVAMGRALVRDPKLFLFDEPLSNLDAKLRIDMRTEIKRLHQSMGTTIVYVTHDQIEAMTLATRIAVLKDGVLQQFGAPADIYDDPANLFVAEFMGSPSMNLFPVTVQAGRAGPEIRVERAGGEAMILPLGTAGGAMGGAPGSGGAGSGAADAATNTSAGGAASGSVSGAASGLAGPAGGTATSPASDLAAWAGREVIFGIRPEAITEVSADGIAGGAAGGDVAGGGTAGGLASRTATAECLVEVVEPAGADTYVVTRLGGKEVVARMSPDCKARAGETIPFAFRLDKAVFFDPETHARIA